MFGYHPGFFGFDFFLLQRCPLCGHPFSFHLGKEWNCTECGCMGFPEKKSLYFPRFVPAVMPKMPIITA